MGREFKFRVWDKKLSCFEFLNDVLRFGCNEIFTIPKNSDNYIVQQFTGLKDKNGIEIYEDDIIQNQAGRKFIVSWVHNGFEYKEILEKQDDKKPEFEVYCKSIGDEKLCRVIGNIYEK